MRYKRERGKEETQLLGQDRKLAKKSMCVKRVQGEHDESRDMRFGGQRSLCRTSRYISRMGLTKEIVIKLIPKI